MTGASLGTVTGVRVAVPAESLGRSGLAFQAKVQSRFISFHPSILTIHRSPIPIMTHLPETVVTLEIVAEHARTCPVKTFVTIAVSTGFVPLFKIRDRDDGVTIVMLGFVELTTILPISLHSPLGVTGLVLPFSVTTQNAIAPEV